MSWMLMIFLSIAYPAWVFDKDENSAWSQKVQQWSTSKEQEVPVSSKQEQNTNNTNDQ